jgi:thiol-disulfide isomerase/thioredoxin
MAKSAFGQSMDVTLENRPFLQCSFAYHFIEARDSLYFAQHGRGKPFESTDSIESFMSELQSAWKRSQTKRDAENLRLESDVYINIASMKSSHEGDWIYEYIWRKYMIPSFLLDLDFCSDNPAPEKASILNPINAGNMFALARFFHLPPEDWHRLYSAYSRMPHLLDTYLDFGTKVDSLHIQYLISTRNLIASLQTFYSISNALYIGSLDSAFAMLATGFCEPHNPRLYLSPLVRELVLQNLQAKETERALTILDIATHWTTTSDLSRDSLRAWYCSVDPVKGNSLFEKASSEGALPALVPGNKRIKLFGRYTDLVTGKPFDFSTTKGKTVFLDFWITSCGPCIEEIPRLNNFVKLFGKQKNFAFVAVASDGSGCSPDISLMRQFVKKKGMKYTVVLDKPDSSLTKLFNVDAYPTKVVISPTGEIMQRPDGNTWIDLSTVEAYLTQKQ